MSEQTEIVELLAALVGGDRWLSAASAAAYLGQMPKKTFLEQAAKPGFPRPTQYGKRRMWRKSELDQHAEKIRDAQQRQRAA